MAGMRKCVWNSFWLKVWVRFWNERRKVVILIKCSLSYFQASLGMGFIAVYQKFRIRELPGSRNSSKSRCQSTDFLWKKINVCLERFEQLSLRTQNLFVIELLPKSLEVRLVSNCLKEIVTPWLVTPLAFWSKPFCNCRLFTVDRLQCNMTLGLLLYDFEKRVQEDLEWPLC